MNSSNDPHDEQARLLSAFSNAKRLRILELLLDNEFRVGELAQEVELSQSALSQHLALLRGDGLVSTRREAQTIYYTTSDYRVRAVLNALRDVYSEPAQIAARR
ncbi:ArsR/SmtB family transcription factor [Rhizobium sp. Rhizsp42]|uniref:ArsR/SmtB family transcription factor n=1 Tax=Rhizobium sp. Rhizsp42 TaxID=3243034 RepID=UPI0039AFF59C